MYNLNKKFIFDTYRIGTKKLFKVNDEYWHQVYLVRTLI